MGCACVHHTSTLLLSVGKLTADLNAKEAELTAARTAVQNAEKKIREFESKVRNLKILIPL